MTENEHRIETDGDNDENDEISESIRRCTSRSSEGVVKLILLSCNGFGVLMAIEIHFQARVEARIDTASLLTRRRKRAS